MSNNYITKEMKDRLYSCMRDKNVTSSDLCRVLNVTYPDLKATFEGKSPLYNKWQRKIADALKVDKEELFRELHEPKLTEAEIRADERRKFAEWLDDKDYLGEEIYDSAYWCYAHQRLNYEEVLAEYEKEQVNN